MQHLTGPWAINLTCNLQILSFLLNLSSLLQFQDHSWYFTIDSISVGRESTGTSGLRLLAHFNIFLPSTCAEVKLLLLSTNSRRRGICPTLTSLYWLLINFGIVFKTSLMFKGLPGTAPRYISESHVPYEPGSESKGVTLVQGSVSEIPDSQCKAGDGRGF